jgi:hypothetical protein
MFIHEVVSQGKQGQAYTSILLRQSYRVGAHVKSKTLAVLTHLPAHVLAAVRRALAQPADSLDQVAAAATGALRIRQGESFGAVWTVDQIAQKLGIKKALGVTHEAELSYWQVLARVLHPGTSVAGLDFQDSKGRTEFQKAGARGEKPDVPRFGLVSGAAQFGKEKAAD